MTEVPGVLGIIWKGILLGLGAAAPIGPVNVEIARRSLRGGFGAGCALGLGAVTVDVCYAVLASLSVRLVVDRPVVLNSLGLAGAGLLAYLGVMCFKSAGVGAASGSAKADVVRSADPAAVTGGTGSKLPVAPSASPFILEYESPAREMVPKRNYLTGLLMTALNPMTLVFWFVVVPGVVGQVSTEPARQLPFICAGVFVGAVGWVVFFASVMSAAGRLGREKVLLVADLGGGVLLLAFAGYAVWRICRSLL